MRVAGLVVLGVAAGAVGAVAFMAWEAFSGRQRVGRALECSTL